VFFFFFFILIQQFIANLFVKKQRQELGTEYQ